MRPRLVVIHFGAHRTGTGYLQSVFRNNAGLLADRGIQYRCILDLPRLHRTMGAARRAYIKGDVAQFERHFAEVRDDLTELRRAHPDEHLLISYEGVLGSLLTRVSRGIYPHHEFLLNRFMNIFEGERVHGVFAVREYGAFLESGHKQLVHMGYKPRLDTRLDPGSIEDFSWLPVVRTLKTVFGAELSLFTYEDFAASNRKLLDWLFERTFGFGAEFLTLAKERVNSSPSRIAFSAMKLSNRMLPFKFTHRLRRRINKQLRSSLPATRFGHPHLLDEQSKRVLKQGYAEDLRIMRNEVPDLYCLPASNRDAGSSPRDDPQGVPAMTQQSSSHVRSWLT